MAKVVMTWTRQDISQDWIMGNIRNPIFNEAEKQVLASTRDIHTSLPGFVSETVDTSNPQLFVFSVEFDTLSNAENALDLIVNPPIGSNLYIRKQLMLNKRAQVGVDYQFNAEVVQ